MNREKISNWVMHWYVGRIAMGICLDEIEAEFVRAHGKLHSDNLDLKKKVVWLNKLVIDLQIEVGRLRFEIAELERESEQGEIVGWINAPHSLLKNNILEVVYYEKKHAEANKNPVHGHYTTVPIRLPKKENPKPEPNPFSRNDFVAMTPEQLEFARELTEPEEGIPESVRAHLELLRKQAGWQVVATVAEHEVANWLLANLKDEAKPKKIRTYAGNLYYDTPSDCMVILDCKVNTCPPYFRFIREIGGEEEVPC